MTSDVAFTLPKIQVFKSISFLDCKKFYRNEHTNTSLHAQETRQKITQLEKERFMKVNELKLTQVELFYFFTLCALLLIHPDCFVWRI